MGEGIEGQGRIDGKFHMLSSQKKTGVLEGTSLVQNNHPTAQTENIGHEFIHEHGLARSHSAGNAEVVIVVGLHILALHQGFAEGAPEEGLSSPSHKNHPRGGLSFPFPDDGQHILGFPRNGALGFAQLLQRRGTAIHLFGKSPLFPSSFFSQRPHHGQAGQQHAQMIMQGGFKIPSHRCPDTPQALIHPGLLFRFAKSGDAERRQNRPLAPLKLRGGLAAFLILLFQSRHPLGHAVFKAVFQRFPAGVHLAFFTPLMRFHKQTVMQEIGTGDGLMDVQHVA
ncbi:hypothetical protein Cva_01672 [Caedimonas varicaedens]|uniref:Uncharacterized protein n=1 Tax=Caedimonas varicaedens TaxID=1629334 RepID=A0A0K8MEX0_9PROT|nr:hypothetical protein Cva_01672 [Caedimonas varicaedens]